MSKTNCINCGAAKELNETKCPFCGTSYFDFTSIDFSSHEPVACQFRISDDNNRHYKMTMLAKPSFRGCNMRELTEYAVNKFGTPLLKFQAGYEADTDVRFEHIVAPNGTLFTLELEEK